PRAGHPEGRSAQAPTDEAWQAMAATLAVAGSEEVTKAFYAAGEEGAKFVRQAGNYERGRDGGELLEGAGIAMEEARQAARVEIDKTLEMTRDELRDL